MFRFTLLLVAMAAAAALIPDSLEQDSSMLLQAEVQKKQQRSGASTSSKSVKEGQGTRASEICQDIEHSLKQEAVEAEPVAFAEAGQETFRPESSSQKMTSTVMICRALLMLGTILIVLDGVRRLLTESKDGRGDKGQQELTLVSAARDGSVEEMERSIAAGADVNSPVAGASPLHVAAHAGQAEACAWLLDHGADIDAKDSADLSPIVAAGAAGEEEVCSFFLDRGAKVPDVPVADMPMALRDVFYWRGLSEER